MNKCYPSIRSVLLPIHPLDSLDSEGGPHLSIATAGTPSPGVLTHADLSPQGRGETGGTRLVEASKWHESFTG